MEHQIKKPPVHVPLELWLEILLSDRLEIKDLLRFKCVCRAWNDLISSFRFARFMLEKSEADPHQKRHRILEIEPLCTFDFNALHLGGQYIDLVPDPKKGFLEDVQIVGSSDSLVCLCGCFAKSKNFTFFIWNPCAGEVATLSEPVLDQNKDSLMFYGFGCDTKCAIGTYKLVLGYLFHSVISGLRKSHYVLYSLNLRQGQHKWRRTKHRLSMMPVNEKMGSFFHGILHWPARERLSPPDKLVVVWYDSSRDIIGKLRLPEVIQLDNHSNEFTLGVLDRCLCVLNKTSPEMVTLKRVAGMGVMMNYESN